MYEEDAPGNGGGAAVPLIEHFHDGLAAHPRCVTTVPSESDEAEMKDALKLATLDETKSYYLVPGGGPDQASSVSFRG